MGNSQGKIRQLKKEIEKGEFKGLIIDRSKSQQEVETQIDRLSDEFQKKNKNKKKKKQKNARPGEIRELERDVGRNSGGLGEMFQDDEYLDRRPIPKCAGVDEKEKRNDPKEEEEKKQNLSKSN